MNFTKLLRAPFLAGRLRWLPLGGVDGSGGIERGQDVLIAASK